MISKHRVLECEHIMCEFTGGHPKQAEHTFSLGDITRLDICDECYAYLIGTIIKEEIEHFAKRTALHSRYTGAISFFDAVDTARSMTSIPDVDIVGAMRRFLDKLVNPNRKAQEELENVGVTQEGLVE